MIASGKAALQIMAINDIVVEYRTLTKKAA